MLQVPAALLAHLTLLNFLQHPWALHPHERTCSWAPDGRLHRQNHFTASSLQHYSNVITPAYKNPSVLVR